MIVACKLDVHAGKNLQAQYERWQPRAKYKMHLDPTMEDVKKLAVSSRRAAKVNTVSSSHRAQACKPATLHTAFLHLQFVQPGHSGSAHLHILHLSGLQTDAIAITIAAPALHLVCYHSLVVLLCLHSSCLGHRPPGSHKHDSVCSTCDSVCNTCAMQPPGAACKRIRFGFPLWLTHAAE